MPRPRTTLWTAIVVSLWATSLFGQTVETRYYLTKSVLVVDGTIENANVITANGTEPKTQPGVTTVTLATISDPDAHYVLKTEEATLSKVGVTVEMSGGTLSALNRSSEGQLGTIVKSVFGAFVAVAKATAGIPMAAPRNAVEQYYLKQKPDDARRRTTLQDTLKKAQAAVQAVQEQIISTTDPKHRALLMERLKDLDANDALLRRLLGEAEVKFEAWKSRTEDRKEQKVRLMIDVDALPEDAKTAALVGTVNPDDKAIQDAAGAFWNVTDRLRIIVTQKGPFPVSPIKPPAAGEVNNALLYRTTRPVILSLYKLTEENQPVLVQQTLEYVVGPKSGTAKLEFKDAKWGKRSLSATFTGGALSKLTTETTPAATAIAETVRALPTEYLAAVKQANEIAGEERKLSLQATEAEIERVKKEKELAEAKISAQEVADLGAAKAELARLDTEIKLLEAQRRSALAGATNTDGKLIQLQQELLRMQNELTKAEIERLELQKKLSGLNGGQ